MSRRHELETRLKGETLVRKGLMREHEGILPLRLIPDLNVIKIGGHGIVDYGRDVVLPLLEEIAELSKQHKILVVTGGGVRVRHIMDIGIDLGMPTGVLAELASKISEQNAVMVSLLLSRWGGSRVKTSDLLDLPTLFHLGLLPVIHATPHRYRGISNGRAARGEELHTGQGRGRTLRRGPAAQPKGEADRGNRCRRADRHGHGGLGSGEEDCRATSARGQCSEDQNHQWPQARHHWTSAHGGESRNHHQGLSSSLQEFWKPTIMVSLPLPCGGN